MDVRTNFSPVALPRKPSHTPQTSTMHHADGIPKFILVPACESTAVETIPPPPVLERWSSEGSSCSRSSCSRPPSRPERQSSLPEWPFQQSEHYAVAHSPASARTCTDADKARPESAPRLPLRTWADDNDGLSLSSNLHVNHNRWAC